MRNPEPVRRIWKAVARYLATAAAALLLAALTAPAAMALEGEELAKVEAMLTALESTEGLEFVRNGKAYDGKRAADHLRTKLRRAGDKVATAERFVALLASGSSISGKPYLVRHPDGREEPSAAYFTSLLEASSRTP